jgi:hypothetical protein
MTKLHRRVIALRDKGLKPSEIAKRLDCSVNYVYNIKRSEEAVTSGPTITINPTDPAPKKDVVNHPEHYTVGGVETIDFIEAKQLGYNLGNAVKYISRAKYKGKQLEDLRKALWYVRREISKLEK